MCMHEAFLNHKIYPVKLVQKLTLTNSWGEAVSNYQNYWIAPKNKQGPCIMTYFAEFTWRPLKGELREFLSSCFCGLTSCLCAALQCLEMGLDSLWH